MKHFHTRSSFTMALSVTHSILVTKHQKGRKLFIDVVDFLTKYRSTDLARNLAEVLQGSCYTAGNNTRTD